MSGRRLLIGCVLLGLAVAVAGSWFLLREPRAQGHSLSYWLRMGNGEYATFLGEPADTPEARAAIREIGDKALPILLAKVAMVDPPWKERMQRACNYERLPLNMLRPAYYERCEGLYGFRVLGTNALPALPELTRMFSSNDRELALFASVALEYLGPSAWPVFWAGLTNSDSGVRYIALLRLSNTNAIMASRPALRSLRDDPDYRISILALRHLMYGTPKDEATAHALAGLASVDPRVRHGILRDMPRDNLERASVVPSVVKLLADADATVRTVATNRLLRLDPVAAAAAGIDTNPSPPAVRWRRGRGAVRSPSATNAAGSVASP